MGADVLREVVLPRLDGVKKAGGGFMARCPAHEDRTASLSISAGRDQPVVFTCHAGCDPEDIAKALGGWEMLSKPRTRDDSQDRQNGSFPTGRWSAIYEYVDEHGALLFQVLRSPAKDFRQRRPDPTAKDGWSWRLGETRRVLYRLPAVIQAVQEGREVWVAEGEKDVHTLERQGVVATCNPGGAGKWRPEFTEVLREAVVTICADADAVGQAHARAVRDALVGVGATVRVVEPVAGKDITDHITAGHKLVDVETTWTNDAPPKPILAPDLWEFIATEDEPYTWIVPDLLERGDRLILTGYEGLGKSFLNRQMAMTLAGGAHPFLWHHSIDPVRVLVIDCENPERQSRRRYRELSEVAKKRGCPPPPGFLRLIHRPAGIDLTRAEDAAWLMERVTAHQPAVLFIGPFYKLHSADMREETAARQAVDVLDAVRTAVDCAMVIEAHAGHGEAGRNRSVRPTGSSLLLRWPEFGFGLVPAVDPQPGKPCMDVEIRHWRGQRDQRQWPAYLTWGDPHDWPWRVSLGPPVKGKATP